eukprot:m.133863 g.133863  ORF g.133863 m.133863 type:complete len:576 (-) comp29702_c0_seq1:23-1750(-)
MDVAIDKIKAAAVTIPKDGSMAATQQLLELRRVLGPRLQASVVSQLWHSGLVSEMVHCLGQCSLQDPSSMGTARALLNMISNCITHQTQASDFNGLPLVSTALGLCGSAVNMTLAQEGDTDNWPEMQMKEDLVLFVEVSLQTLRRIAEQHASVAAELLKNGNTLPLLMAEDARVSRACLLVLHSIAGSWEALIKELDVDIVSDFAEECCFQLVEGVDAFDAQHSAELLLIILLAAPTVIAKLRQFSGVAEKIVSRWSSESFASEVKEIAEFFEADTLLLEKKEQRRLNQASTMIQSAWRGVVGRRLIAKMGPAATTIQRAWRLHQEIKLTSAAAVKKTEAQEHAYLEHQQQLRIQSKIAAMREFAEVSAVNVSEYLQRRRVSAAITIQRWWRVLRIAITAPTTHEQARRHSSARIIQTAYRDYRSRQRRKLPLLLATMRWIPPTIMEPRRDHLLKQIQQRWPHPQASIDTSDITTVNELYVKTQTRLGDMRAEHGEREWMTQQRLDLIESITDVQNRHQDVLSEALSDPKIIIEAGNPWHQQVFTQPIRVDAAKKHRLKLLEMSLPAWKRGILSP